MGTGVTPPEKAPINLKPKRNLKFQISDFKLKEQKQLNMGKPR
jgi:hypothetical protein